MCEGLHYVYCTRLGCIVHLLETIQLGFGGVSADALDSVSCTVEPRIVLCVPLLLLVVGERQVRVLALDFRRVDGDSARSCNE